MRHEFTGCICAYRARSRREDGWPMAGPPEEDISAVPLTGSVRLGELAHGSRS